MDQEEEGMKVEMKISTLLICRWQILYKTDYGSPLMHYQFHGMIRRTFWVVFSVWVCMRGWGRGRVYKGGEKGWSKLGIGERGDPQSNRQNNDKGTYDMAMVLNIFKQHQFGNFVAIDFQPMFVSGSQSWFSIWWYKLNRDSYNCLNQLKKFIECR